MCVCAWEEWALAAAAFNSGGDSRGDYENDDDDDAGICQTCHTQNSLTVIKTTTSGGGSQEGRKTLYYNPNNSNNNNSRSNGSHMANVRPRLCLTSAGLKLWGSGGAGFV